MIKSYAYDVEVLPNFFSVTIIDVNSYLKTFSDSCTISDKGKINPIPLVQKYTVKEIREKLDNVIKYKYYITDKDDSQLLSMLGFLNQLRPHRNEKNQAVRSDMFGYNTSRYDRLMIAGLLMFANQTNTTKELITKLYELSKHIISTQDNYEMQRHDYFLNMLNKYSLPYTDIDLMTIFALNKVTKAQDAKGNTVWYGKGLKQTSINLQWYELLEYELPPISDLDIYFYNKIDKYSSLTNEEVDKLVDKWDRYIIDDWIEPMMHYNENDVFICCEMIRLYIDEIRLRYNISKAYEIDVLSSSRSNIADKMFIKFYSDFSGLSESQWRGRKTERTALSFKRVILPSISFKTKEVQELLEEMKQVIVYSVGKKALKEVANKYSYLKYLKTNNDSGWFEIKINNLIYTIATGGLHSQDIPRELKSKIKYIDGVDSSNIDDDEIWNYITDDSYIYCHADVSDDA